MNAIDFIATRARRTCAAAVFGTIFAALLVGCGVLPDKPKRATLYDFGPGPLVVAPAPTTTALPTLALADFEANARLEGTQMLYRLGYADANELRPYSQARWSLAPAQLLRQRLRDALAEQRTVLDTQESAALARTAGRRPDTLRISLDEFTHYFESPDRSSGLIRLRATLVRSEIGGDRVLAQKLVTVQRPAPTADAPGGVKALVSASDAAVVELVQWLAQQR